MFELIQSDVLAALELLATSGDCLFFPRAESREFLGGWIRNSLFSELDYDSLVAAAEFDRITLAKPHSLAERLRDDDSTPSPQLRHRSVRFWAFG
jgi:hypothetical protein